ncbi:hypothetical protein [Glycomyces tritici]|uniref:DUF4175 domain-containing protein n=1 Tax=Glycomyces tritici TaxID=2665176 RepID=A0ABT7YWB0_9ACTN|nr:hypothetical protein [Glycomyces tritici]MDN3240894.1 hypothetical protein [Glycomyces tritici]MDN3242903.1 hypothetical protein [Glycomyces tritici]
MHQVQPRGDAGMSERPKVPPAGRVLGWVLVVVAVAFAARMVWEILRPLVPVLIALLAVGIVYLLIFRRWFS